MDRMQGNAGRSIDEAAANVNRPRSRASSRRLAVVLLVALGAGCASDGRTAIPHGTLHHYEIEAPSLGKTRSVRVYLPPSYDRPDAAMRRYPVVFLLHGWPGGDGNWTGQGRAAVTLDSMAANHTIPEVIAVMPNGNGPGWFGRSLYLDTWDGKFKLQTFIVRDLVAWVDRTFRTRPEASQRAIAGLSDGGSAAVNIALKHPQVFGAAAGMSAHYRWHPFLAIARITGPPPGADSLLAANSPLAYVGGLRGRIDSLALYIDSGLEDAHILAGSRAFHARLDSLGIPHAYREYHGGHSWTLWKRHLRDALLVITGRFAR
jgi:S-formylglutathione hydrolase FrmB